MLHVNVCGNKSPNISTIKGPFNSEQILFSRFDSIYENMVALEDQIHCKEFQDEAGEKYDKIASHLSARQKLVRGVCQVTVCQQKVAKYIALFIYK